MARNLRKLCSSSEGWAGSMHSLHLEQDEHTGSDYSASAIWRSRRRACSGSEQPACKQPGPCCPGAAAHSTIAALSVCAQHF